MNRLSVYRIAAFVGLVVASGCGSTASNPATSTPPVTYEQKTETYSGTLASGETKPFHFTVTNPGSLDAAITALAPVSTLTMGLYLGGWDATTETCPKSSVFNDASRLNLALSGTPQQAGEYCVAIYDVGNVQSRTDFTLTVLHY
jgi:hypothetical protein